MFNKSLFKNYSGFFNFFSRLSDPLVVLLAAYIAFELKFRFSDSTEIIVVNNYKLLAMFVFFCVSTIFPLFDLYGSWRGQSLTKQAKAVIWAWMAVLLIVIVLLFAFKLSDSFSRLWLGYWGVLGLAMLLSMRIAIYGFLQYQRSKGRNIRRVVLVGAGELGNKATTQVNSSHWMGYRIKAVFDDNPKLKNTTLGGVEILGDLDAIDDYLSSHDIDEIWLALPLREELRMRQLMSDISHHAVNIKLIPDIFGFSLLHHSMTEIAGLPAVNLSVSPMDTLGNKLIKEIEDRVLSLGILIAISPLMLLIALGIKLTSQGPIFYRQERISWNGKTFSMLKFRSMNVSSEEDGVVWGNAKNKDVTKFGQFLRKTSLDELPQFINVLKGDMSIVGPRPERAEFVEKFKHEIPGYMQKHMVKAGITGWAQIHGWRGDTCLKTRIEHDLYYIENWSLLVDIKIILLTFLKGFFHKNAY